MSYLFHGAAILLVLLLYSPYVLYYNKAYFPTGCDRLNELPMFMFNSISEILANNDYVISRFGEAKRFCFPSEFYPIVWFIYFFGPLNYIIFISISSGLVSYIGSWLLLEKHVYPFFNNKFNVSISDMNDIGYCSPLQFILLCCLIGGMVNTLFILGLWFFILSSTFVKIKIV